MNSNLTLKRSLLLSFLFTCLTLFNLQAQSDATVVVTAPANVAGAYPVIQAAFGPGITADVTGAVVEGVDVDGMTTVCDTVANDLTGSIALVDRGACGFVDKVANAEEKGAIAVIVCNNSLTSPNSAFPMGGTGTITIPSVMMSYNFCQTIRMEIGNGLMVTLNSTGIPSTDPGELCDLAIDIAPGTHTVDDIDSGFGAILGGAGNAAWYTYTPAANTIATVSSCALTAEDTRVYIFEGIDCDPANLFIVATNDDCDPDNGFFASETTFTAYGGNSYWIYWDDRWSGAGFDFDLTESALPVVDVTVTVDMSNETVAVDGAHFAGETNGWTGEPMTDNGDGTWSITLTGLTTTDTIEYKFQNGMGGWENDFDSNDCGFNNNRVFETPSFNATASPVCFNSCEACPPPACTDPDAIICDDFEMYTLSDISGQSANWTPWGGVAGAGDDATVSDAFAFGGTQSLLISEANGDDMLLLLGDVTTGNYLLEWKMYIPAGSTGYFNTQKDQVPNTEFGMQVEFFADGTSTLDAGAADIVTTNWTADTWMDISLRIDLTNDWMIYTLNGEEVYSWPASWTTFTETGLLQLGAINFFGNAGTIQYIDNVLFKTLPECPDDAVICDSYEAYVSGTTTGGQAPWWTTWSGVFGTDEDGIVSSDQAYDGSNSMLIGDNGVQDVVLALGDQTSGNWSIEMQMYVPTDNIGYFNIQETEVPGTQWNMEAWFNGNNTSGYTAGMGQLASGETFATPQDTWFPVVNMIDLDNGTHTLIVDGVTVLDNIAYAGAQIGGLDFFSISGENTAYFDAIRFIELEPVIADPVDVTFHVDMAQVIDAMPAFIAGSFNNWTGEAMTDNLDDTYSFTIALTPGETYEYKFQNGAGGWEGGIPAACSVDPDGNRTVTVGAAAMDVGLVCFNECAACVPIAVDEKTFAAALGLFPNPTADATNLTYNFNESLNLDITVSNTIGQQLYRTSLEGVQSGSHTIDLSNFTPGIYLVQMTDGKNNLTKRLVVQ